MGKTSTELAEQESVTEFLRAWSGGDGGALGDLMPKVHESLRKIARGYLNKERRDHTLETSALVNEAFLRLVDQHQVTWRDRAHFFAISSQMMRRILVDHARRHISDKRGGQWDKISLDALQMQIASSGPEVLELDDALRQLSEQNESAAKIVEMRFFAGLDREAIAEVLEVSSATVTRRWLMARAWLRHYLVHGECLEL